MDTMTMHILLHVCCAPCLIGTKRAIDKFSRDQNINIKFTCYWYNPNIHPYTEYRARLDALKKYSEENYIELIVQDDYGLVEFTKNVINNLSDRCGYCYSSRIGNAAKYAAENNFDAFSSSLFVSPYQNHEKMRETGEKYSHMYDKPFLYIDSRPEFREGQREARERGVYMQKYCGCIFSEEERYVRNKKNRAT